MQLRAYYFIILNNTVAKQNESMQNFAHNVQLKSDD